MHFVHARRWDASAFAPRGIMRDRPCLFMRHLRPGMRLDRTFHAASRSHSLTFVHVGSVVATVVIEVSDWHVRGLSVRTHPRCVSPTATGFDVSYCYLLLFARALTQSETRVTEAKVHGPRAATPRAASPPHGMANRANRGRGRGGRGATAVTECRSRFIQVFSFFLFDRVNPLIHSVTVNSV
jgi:hypothetical protein